MLSELQELRAAKRNLEESLQEMTDVDRQRVAEMKRLGDLRKTELARAKKESDIEIRKLVSHVVVSHVVVGLVFVRHSTSPQRRPSPFSLKMGQLFASAMRHENALL